MFWISYVYVIPFVNIAMILTLLKKIMTNNPN